MSVSAGANGCGHRLDDRGGDAGQIGRLGHPLGHRRDAGRVLFGAQALEERGHLLLEGGHCGADLLDA